MKDIDRTKREKSKFMKNCLVYRKPESLEWV